MQSYLIQNVIIVNEGTQKKGDVLIKDQHIATIRYGTINRDYLPLDTIIINAEGQYLLPGIIDCHVHFREPGLTHKASINTESRAAIAGGVTSIMEMPNTVPPTTTNKLIEKKQQIANKNALCNYAFYLGATNNNIREIIKADYNKIPGIKLFMGSSTGNMLVDDQKALEKIFNNCPSVIVTHCEEEQIISNNNKIYLAKYGEEAPASIHKTIRNEEACYISTQKAISLAKQYKQKLHIAHLTTANEIKLLEQNATLEKKLITAEASIHHLFFDDLDYHTLGNKIKCNPAIKSSKDRLALLEALNNDTIDIIATDHAPHNIEEKEQPYFKAPSGIPMIQHSLVSMLELNSQNQITIEKIVEKMAHNPAKLFKIEKRGFIREGFWADLVLVDMKKAWTVTKNNILYKCGWSPFEGKTFNSTITHTFVNGFPVLYKHKLNTEKKGMPIIFNP